MCRIATLLEYACRLNSYNSCTTCWVVLDTLVNKYAIDNWRGLAVNSNVAGGWVCKGEYSRAWASRCEDMRVLAIGKDPGRTCKHVMQELMWDPAPARFRPSHTRTRVCEIREAEPQMSPD